MKLEPTEKEIDFQINCIKMMHTDYKLKGRIKEIWVKVYEQGMKDAEEYEDVKIAIGKVKI